MMHPPSCQPRSIPLVSCRPEHHEVSVLQSRVVAEFREMPRLRLMLAQAVRLFGIDNARCQRVLAVLVQHGVLATDGRTFARADAGVRSA